MPEGAEVKDPLEQNTVLARVGGDVRLLHELVEMFREDSPKWMSEIRRHIGQSNTSGVKFFAHILRGSIGNFGICPAYEFARRLELMACAGNLEGAQDAYQYLEAAIQRLESALAALSVNSRS